MKVYVQHSSYCDHSERAEEQYGSWSESHTFTVRGASAEHSRLFDGEAFDVDFYAGYGETVYVLAMTYGTGDSFGSSTGNGEILWVFKDPLIAREAKMRWQHACNVHGKDWRNDGKQQSCTFRVDGGRYVKLSNPVYGCFEHLESLELHTFHMR